MAEDDDILEMILQWLPITDLIKASLVCKKWRSVIRKSALLRNLWSSAYMSRPWLMRYNNGSRSVMALDPFAGSWNALPPLFNGKSDEGVLFAGFGEGGSEIFYFFLRNSRVRYAVTWKTGGDWEWREASRMCWWREHSVVCYVRELGQLFVVGIMCGGGCKGRFSANILHLESGIWHLCDVLPPQFGNHNSDSLTCALLRTKIYVSGIRSGYLCVFDLQRKRWGRVVGLKDLVEDMETVYLVGQKEKSDCLITAIIGNSRAALLNLEVRKDGIRCREIGRMPKEMIESLVKTKGDDNSKNVNAVSCRGMGDVIYFFNVWSGVCICCISEKMSENEASSLRWKLVLPPPFMELKIQSACLGSREYGCWPLNIDNFRV